MRLRPLTVAAAFFLSISTQAQGPATQAVPSIRASAPVEAAEPLPSASEVLADAQQVAAREGKNVLIIFHASWCGWCRKMEAAMDEPAMKPLFEKSYVIRYLDVYEQPAKKSLENPGADELLRKYKGFDMGVPYFIVFNAKGEKLSDSQAKEGENIGCPAEDSEVAYFVSVLKKTGKLSQSELDAVSARFKKNK